MNDAAEGWIESNQRQLVAALAHVRRALEQRSRQLGEGPGGSAADAALSADPGA